MLSEKKVSSIYNFIEIKLISVLAQMEMNGILVDAKLLSNLSNQFSTQLNFLEKKIYTLSGGEFNIGSPKQLGEILFEKLDFKGGKKGKSGTYSTDVDILETLASEGHDLPHYVLEWRQLSKLRSTYTESLQNHIKLKTGRVHSSFLSSGATTGRLSSSNPNLQNIPIRTKDGRKIRSAFISEDGYKLVSFDYSQIELRILAHIARIHNLIEAFKDGQDIHSQTASEVFQVPIEDLNPELRRQAKAINFGIIYGISPFGLANNLRIPREKAKNFIDKYFDRYPEIKNYMDQTINKAKENARQNLVKVPVINYTIPHEIIGKHGASRVLLKPAPYGTGIIAGSAVRLIMEQVGINNIYSKVLGSNNAMNVAKAVMNALTSLQDVRVVAKKRGKTPKTLFET